VLGIVAVALVLAMTLAGLGQVVAGRARAQTAADRAPRAAATRWQATADLGGSCDLAGQAAARNGADLAGCEHEGVGVVRVTVSVRTPFGPTTTSARAGPSSAR
jgi:secretion/DNA translocation related TadE-like protein